MPKFPDRNAIQDPGSLRSGRHIVQASEVDASAQFAGLKKVGAALVGLSGDIHEREQKQKNEQDALDLLKADVEHKKSLIQLDTELGDDNDYASHDSKFSKRANEATERAGGLIRDPDKREKWRLRATLENEGQRAGVIKRADSLMTEQRKVELNEALTGYSTIYTSPKSTPEQRMAARRDIENGITLAERSGILKPAEARKLRGEFNNGIEIDDIKRRQIEEPEALLRDLRGSGVDMKAPGLQTPGNIDLSRRPVVKNEDGSISTVKSMSVNIGGREVLLPTIGPDGKELDEEGAVRLFQETGQHLGMFDTLENATAYAKKLSTKMGKRANATTSAMITAQLETGIEGGPLQGVAQIAPDSDGTKSYGNFGLNSGGSIQKFAEEYLGETSITAKPGTKAFDKQWKEFAAADPEFLHSLEMQWYEEKILPRISGDLAGAGVDQTLAADPRVQAYFADRLIQYGPASIKSHSQRIAQAAEAAEGDPVVFLKEMSETDTANLHRDFRTYLRDRPNDRPGLSNRVANRERLALGTAEADQPGGVYATLTPLQRAQAITETEQKIRTTAEANRAQYRQMLKDDVESIRKTGMGVDNFDLEGASRILDKSQISTWEMDRLEAEHEYRSLSDLRTLTDNQLSQRLDNIRPSPGEEWYGIKSKVYDKAETEIKRIREQRIEDPAVAVADDPAVREAQSTAAAMPGSPSATQDLVRARLDAQQRVGVSANLQSPLTMQEARTVASRVRGLSGKSLTTALVPLQEELANTYGPYARAVGVQVVETITRDRDLADSVQGMIDRVFKGQEPTASQLRQTELLNEGSLALRALGGYTTPHRMYGIGRSPDELEAPELADNPNTHYLGFGQPPVRAILHLQQNPALAAQFDAKYGPGAAAAALSTPISTEAPTE